MSALFSAVLGDDFKKLHPAVARFHGTGPGAHAEGLFRVTRGNGPLSYAMGWIMRLPRSAAAEQGDAKAQYNLGLMHGHGKGVPENHLTHSCAVLFALVIGVAGEVQHA